MKETVKYQNSNGQLEHLDDNELAQYAEYLRDETLEVPERLTDHVAACSYCRGELMSITDLLATLPEEIPEVAGETAGPAESSTIPVAQRTSFSVIKLIGTAAAVAAVVLISWGIRQLFTERPMNEPIARSNSHDSTQTLKPQHTNPIITNAPTSNSLTINPQTVNPQTGNPHTANPLSTNSSAIITTSVADTILYADAYIPNPVYENLIGAKYRSGRDPKVAGPGPEVVFAAGDTLKISWTPDPEDEYALIIIDNRARPVREIKALPGKSLAWGMDLKPGLYYWKFLGKEEMWKVGRIWVGSRR